MPAAFDLADLLRNLATRNPGRTEADIQAMVRDALVYGGFELGDEAVGLETPAEDHRRLDVSVGALIIECKRDLRPPGNLSKGQVQLGEYLAAKSAEGRYSGILTDGVIWLLYRHTASGTVLVDEFQIHPTRVDERAFRWWLGAILSTESQIRPTSSAIEERLGASNPSFRLVRGALMDCWHDAEPLAAVRLKRQLWAKLLRSALGAQFEDSDELFVEHTYLVLLATLIGHAVAGFDLGSARHNPGVFLSGQLFEQAGILGVGQAGFFDWVLDSSSGPDTVSDIARRVATFDWTDVDHDVLKSLYHSVIAPEVRKRLGEYYTPDWLAKRMVDDVIQQPLDRKVLDPACGSGTFVFHAARTYLDAAFAAGMETPKAIAALTSSVYGMDLHPVAVALAQTTYLLAIGPERLAERTDALSIPIYLGDSMRWEAEDEGVLTPTGDVVLYVTDEAGLYEWQLRFPASVVGDVGRFDRLVNELTARASDRKPGGPRPRVRGLLQNLAVPDEDQPVLEATYDVLCSLYDQGRDHVWGYYIRNQSRPTWLSRPENRVDVLIGNPPWLAYRFMSSRLQGIYERRARERNLWRGGSRGRSTQQDLSAYFVVRSVELYLKQGGRFGFVMPRAFMSRQTYEGFRTGRYSVIEQCYVEFSKSWDLGAVRPNPFPVPSGVTFGKRADNPKPLPQDVLAWSGNSPRQGSVGGTLSATEATISAVSGEESSSPYKNRFRQGAILVPRMLIMVTGAPSTPLGVPKGRRAIQSRKTSLDKMPWKALPSHQGVVETIFIRPAYLGESIAPFRVLSKLEALIPYDGTRFMHGEDDRIERYPGLAAWWRKAEDIWMKNRTSEKRTLMEQLDYMKQLSAQFPIPAWRVVYTKAGNTMAAAVVNDAQGIIDHKLYWAPAKSRDEAAYLSAVLNAPILNEIVRPYQSVGLFGPRDFDKYVWQAPIPAYDAKKALHSDLVRLAGEASDVAAEVVITAGLGFQQARRLIRGALSASGTAAALDETVKELIQAG